MPKTVYIYDEATGEYLYPYDAQENLDAPGEFITPTFSTEFHPPFTISSQVACFISGAWQVKPDYRGTVWYKSDGTPVPIATIGMPDASLSQTKPLMPVMMVTPLQAKLALNQAGLLAQVQNAVNAADIATQLAWSNALTFERNSPFILNMAAALGLSPAQIDQLFLSASSFT
jgi:hypothetical protein